MKKILFGIAVWALITPIAFAAYDTLTLTTSAVISVSGGTLTVSGSSAVVESVVVGADSFTVTLLPGSTFTVAASGNKNIDVIAPGPITSTLTCNSSGSSTLALSGAPSSVTVTITPSGTCGATTGSGGGSSGGGGGIIPVGGGGGGGGGGWTPPSPAPTPAPGPATHPSSSVFVTEFGIGAEGADVTALQTILEAKGFLVMPAGIPKGIFGGLTKKALQAYQTSLGINPTGYVGPKTLASLNGASPTPPPASTSPAGGFSGEFGIGAEGADVTALQTILEAKGFLVMPAGIPKGIFGGLTKKALQAYQTSLGINPTGYVGPKTLASLSQ